MGDGDRAQADVFADHDGAGAFADHHFGDAVDFDLDGFDARQGTQQIAADRRHAHRGGVFGDSDRRLLRRAESGVDRIGQTARGGRVRPTQGEHEVVGGCGNHAALNDRACGHTGRRRRVFLHAAARTFNDPAADLHRALGQRVDLAVDGLQRRHDQGAALKAAGIAERRHRHIEPAARPHKRRQLRRDGDRSDVARGDVSGIHAHAEATQHARDALARVAHALAVALPLQANDEAVADERVFAVAGDVDEVFHAGRLLRARRGSDEANDDTDSDEQRDAHDGSPRQRRRKKAEARRPGVPPTRGSRCRRRVG